VPVATELRRHPREIARSLRHQTSLVGYRRLVGVILLAQGVSNALGGPSYKDTFSLPHTETAAVAKALKTAGLDSQNGASGTVVLKQRPERLRRRRLASSPRSASSARPATRSRRYARRGRPSTARRTAPAQLVTRSC
jgi:hypothetical protein